MHPLSIANLEVSEILHTHASLRPVYSNIGIAIYPFASLIVKLFSSTIPSSVRGSSGFLICPLPVCVFFKSSRFLFLRSALMIFESMHVEFYMKFNKFKQVSKVPLIA